LEAFSIMAISGVICINIPPAFPKELNLYFQKQEEVGVGLKPVHELVGSIESVVYKSPAPPPSPYDQAISQVQ
jgi:hypothetical protein